VANLYNLFQRICEKTRLYWVKHYLLNLIGFPEADGFTHGCVKVETRPFPDGYFHFVPAAENNIFASLK
jgi:hypothetical protein